MGGTKKHFKTLNAPKHWGLSKLGGIFAPKPSPGPHKTRECLPLILILRNRLKYALNGREVTAILMQRFVKVDGKVRTDSTYPAGLMDVIDIDTTDEHFRLLYDSKGRFVTHRISKDEAHYKLCKVKRQQFGKGGVPYIVTHDGRTIRYPDPDIKVNDTIVYDLVSGKVTEHIKFDLGQVCMVVGGKNRGRVGTVISREKHKGSFDIGIVRDAAGNEFATRLQNVFVIGKESNPLISLPKGKGVRLTIIQEQEKLYSKA